MMSIDYAICGGGAIDLFLGRKTRPHKDLDVSAYWEDRDAVVRHMLNDGWDIYEPVGTGYLHKIDDVSLQKRLKSNIWCVKQNNNHYRFLEREQSMFQVFFDHSDQNDLSFIEFLFNTRDDSFFYYARDDAVKRKLSAAIMNRCELPYLAPEIVLLYKSAAAINPDYQKDFDNAYPFMSIDQKDWFSYAMDMLYPGGHIWNKK
jgi:hypothetical protein